MRSHRRDFQAKRRGDGLTASAASLRASRVRRGHPRPVPHAGRRRAAELAAPGTPGRPRRGAATWGLTLSCVPQSLWVERTSLYLVQSLPGISRWFEVEKREVVRARLDSHVLCRDPCSPGVALRGGCFCFGLRVPGSAKSELVMFADLSTVAGP